MTIIVINRNSRQIVADKQVTIGNTFRICTKLFKLESKKRKNKEIDSYIVGIFGDWSKALELKEWFENEINNVKDNPFPEFNNSLDLFGNEKYKCSSDAGIVVVDIRNNKVFSYHDSKFPVEYEDEFVAFGSGQDIALGYHLYNPSADLVELVEEVSKVDIYCGQGYTEFNY